MSAHPEDNLRGEEITIGEIDASTISALFAGDNPKSKTDADLVELTDDENSRPQPVFGALADDKAPTPSAIPDVFTPLTREEREHDAQPRPRRPTQPPAATPDIDFEEFPQEDYESGAKKLSLQDRLAIAKHDLGRDKAVGSASNDEERVSLRQWREERRREKTKTKSPSSEDSLGIELNETAAEYSSSLLSRLRRQRSAKSEVPAPAPEEAPAFASAPAPEEAPAFASAPAPEEAPPLPAPTTPIPASAAKVPAEPEPTALPRNAEDEAITIRQWLRERRGDRGTSSAAASTEPDSGSLVSLNEKEASIMTALRERFARGKTVPPAFTDSDEGPLPVFAVPTSNEPPPVLARARAHGLLAFSKRNRGFSPVFAGVDATAPSPFERIRESVRPTPNDSYFAALLNPLSGPELAMLQQDVQQSTPLFFALERTRARGAVRYQLGFIVGVVATVWFFLKVGSGYPDALTAAASAYHATWLHLDSAQRNIFNGLWFGFGLLLPFLAGLILAEAVNYVWRGLADRRIDDLALGLVACICGVVIYRALISEQSVAVALVFLVAWLVLRTCIRFCIRLGGGHNGS